MSTNLEKRVAELIDAHGQTSGYGSIGEQVAEMLSNAGLLRDDTHNGWANRETWAVALHINNDQGWQESVHEAVRQRLQDEGEAYSFGDVDDILRARWAGEAIKDDVEQMLDLLAEAAAENGALDPSVLDLMRDIGSLWRVDWDELGAAFLDDVTEEGDATDKD